METMYLSGSEDVARAASTMASAAATMSNAASSISHTMEQHQRFLDDWLQRYETLVEKTQLAPSAPSIFEQVFGRKA